MHSQSLDNLRRPSSLPAFQANRAGTPQRLGQEPMRVSLTSRLNVLSGNFVLERWPGGDARRVSVRLEAGGTFGIDYVLNGF